VHELAICTALLDEVGRIARDSRARRVVSIVVRVGPLAGVEPASLRNAYCIASAGTPAAGARLVLEDSAVRVRCLQCDTEAAVPCNELSCPRCGCWRTQLLSGEELMLTSIELERETEGVRDV